MAAWMELPRLTTTNEIRAKRAKYFSHGGLSAIQIWTFSRESGAKCIGTCERKPHAAFQYLFRAARSNPAVEHLWRAGRTSAG